MSWSEVSTLILYLLVPLVLIGRVAFVRHASFVSHLLDVVLAGVWLAAIGFAGLWLALPRVVLWALIGFWITAVAARALGRWARAPRTPPSADSGPPASGEPASARSDSESSGRHRFLRAASWGLRSLLVLVAAWMSVTALLGHRSFPEPSVELAFPLGSGTWLIANGGSTPTVNPHMKTLDPDRAPAYRGQSYAVDIVAVGGWGSRRSGISPDGPEGFAIYGVPVHAPCRGGVVRSRDGDPDLLTGGDSWIVREGNHVLLDCDGTWVLLAHLQRGSVRVAPGDLVETGAVVGLAGNSGASGEPHLHIHAQTPGTSGAPLSGDPLPVTFEGRHLVRNDRVVVR